MAKYRYFDIYLQILSAILNIYKLERFKILSLEQVDEALKADQDQELLRVLRAATKVPLILPDVIEILN